MSGDQGSTTGCCASFTAEQDQEAEESNDELNRKQPHGCESEPGMEGVEIRYLRVRQLMRVPDSEETNGNADNGKGMEHGMK